MAWKLDARVPVLAVADRAGLRAALASGPPAALLVAAGSDAPPATPGVPREDYDPATPHAVACACCLGRAPAATALDRLFLARVRGDAPWFDRVLALVETEQARAGLAATLAGDAVTSARFRPG